jgi:tetratricopeptide (TPR) repeat protein
MWDTDTIEMEKQKFPEVYELITGRFIRHSPEYYEWRVEDRLKKLKDDPNNLQYLDDLAVGYSKLKQDKEAIKIMFQKEKIAPGKYETYANLGTFYLHDGQLKKGIEYIDKAIEINPDAHFGREVYQKYLAEYLLSKGYQKGFKLPICKTFERDVPAKDFYAFLKKKLGKERHKGLTQEELSKAIKGITGMMKFGNYDSPILLEVLGDLLFYGAADWNKEQAHRNLAIVSYYKASLETLDEQSKKKYLIKVDRAARILKGEHRAMKKLMSDLENDIKRADHYFERIRENELKWIAEGKDVDAKFSKVYYGIETKQEESKTETKIEQEEKLQEEDIPASEGSNFFNWMITILLSAFLIGLFLFIKNGRK